MGKGGERRDGRGEGEGGEGEGERRGLAAWVQGGTRPCTRYSVLLRQLVCECHPWSSIAVIYFSGLAWAAYFVLNLLL